MSADYDGKKVIHFLRGAVGCSYALVRSLKTTHDGILCNGAHIRTIDHVRAGDVISITLRDTPKQMIPSALEVEALYEDEDIVVYNKPAGMPCHPSKGLQTDTLANVFARHCAQRGVARTCRVLNRLDKDTTGAVLIAKNSFAAAALTGHVDKLYLAVANGVLNPPKGIVDAPIGRPDPLSPRREVMYEGGQVACTEYRTVAVQDGYSVVLCTLPTGRTHQIRVHMRYLGCPLLGDPLYGGPGDRIERQALHCARLSFLHPITGNPLVVEAPVPKDMQKLLGNLQLRW